MLVTSLASDLNDETSW